MRLPELCLPAARWRTTRGRTLPPPPKSTAMTVRGCAPPRSSPCCQVWRDEARVALTVHGRERRGRESWPCWSAAELLSVSATSSWATANECDCRRSSSVRAVAHAADAFCCAHVVPSRRRAHTLSHAHSTLSCERADMCGLLRQRLGRTISTAQPARGVRTRPGHGPPLGATAPANETARIARDRPRPA